MVGVPLIAAVTVPAVVLLLKRPGSKKAKRPEEGPSGDEGAQGSRNATEAAKRGAGGEPSTSQAPPEASARAPGELLASGAAPVAVKTAAEPPKRGSPLELRVITGKHAGEVFNRLVGDTVRIGRFAGNAVCISDSEVSSQHAELKWSDDKGCWLLMDLGSLNGTLLNGSRVSKNDRAKGDWHPLRDGDVIAFGERDESPSVRVALLQAAGEAPHAVRAQPAFSVAEEAGSKGKASEDRVLCECPLRDFPAAGLFAVVDGHCGPHAAEQAQALLSQEVCRALKAHEAEVGRGDASGALRDAVAALDRQITCEYEGCAATLVLVWKAPNGPAAAGAGDGGANGGGGAHGHRTPPPLQPLPWATDAGNGEAPPELFVQAANVGDCRAVLGEAARDDDDGPGSVRTTASNEADGLGSPDPWPPGAAGGSRHGAAAPGPAQPRGSVASTSGGGGGGAGAARLGGSASGSASGRSLGSTVGAGNSGVGLGGGGGARGSAAGRGLRARGVSVLTFDHKVKAPEEHSRILGTGFPIQEGDGRVYGLALSRTLGDRFLKAETQAAIIAEPHVSAPHRVAAAGGGPLLVVGSDGLWDVTSPQRAVEIAAAVREEWGMRKECAEALVRHARAHRSRDDCSVVVVDLDAQALGLHLPSDVPTTRAEAACRAAGGGGAGGLPAGGLPANGGGGGVTPTAPSLAACSAATKEDEELPPETPLYPATTHHR